MGQRPPAMPYTAGSIMRSVNDDHAENRTCLMRRREFKYDDDASLK